MATRTGDKAAEDRIAEGMAEAGTGEQRKTGGDAAKGQRGHGADPANVGRDMAESAESGAGKSGGADQEQRR
jgi:hypothetical protein